MIFEKIMRPGAANFVARVVCSRSFGRSGREHTTRATPGAFISQRPSVSPTRFIVYAFDLPPDSPMAVLRSSNVAHHSTVNTVEIAVILFGRKFNILYKNAKKIRPPAVVISGPLSHSGDIRSRRPQDF